MATLPLGVRSTIDIPPGVKDYKWSDAFTIPVAVEVPAITPHAALSLQGHGGLGDAADGGKKVADLDQGLGFRLAGPVPVQEAAELPAGTKVEMVYTYDNSADNPRNPNSPPKRVHRGEQTTDEMGITFISLMPKNPSDISEIRTAMREHFLSLGADLGWDRCWIASGGRGRRRSLQNEPRRGRLKNLVESAPLHV